MFRHFIYTILLACTIVLLSHYYLYIRLIVPFFGEHDPFWIITFIGLCGLSIFGFVILRIVPHFLRKPFEFVMFLWMGVAFIALIFSVLTMPIDLVFQYFQINKIYLWYFVVTLSALVSFYAIFNAIKLPDICHVTIPVNNDLPNDIENLTIGIISDVHVSGLIGKKRVKKITEMVNSLNVDVICITGDLVDGTVEQLYKQIDPFKNLTAKKMIVYITGNHEFYSGPHLWKEFFNHEFKWKILSNSSQIINFENFSLNILGIEDRHWLRYKQIPIQNDKRLETSVNHLKDHITEKQKFSYNILLAHQPLDWKSLIQFPWIDLQLSGHTHGGGQVWPLHYIVKRIQKYCAGLYKIPETNQHIYVNQGTGFWGPPMRLGTRSEITYLQFEKKQIV